MARKTDNNENIAISILIDEDVIEQVRTGEVTRICLEINDYNYREILENVDGHLMLVVDEMPATFHGCYLYNNGEFPYAIKDSLDFLILEGGDDHCLAKIIGINAEPGMRFCFQGPDEPRVEDPEGDSCIWEIQFEVVPVPEEPRYYLMRWNPAVSSFADKDYKDCIAKLVHDMFRMNWSIYDWQEARRGDFFFMMRTGDDKAGIVFTGMFITDLYFSRLDTRAGPKLKSQNVCRYGPLQSISSPQHKPQNLSTVGIPPSLEWAQGHSGELLSEDVVKQLKLLWDKKK